MNTSDDPLPPNAGTTTRAAMRGTIDLPILGNYQCIRIIGSGAAGTVYAAVDRRDQRRVALKVLRTHEGMDRETEIRFRREAEHARTIRHPNVVEYLDYGIDGDRMYIAMELLNGGDAANLIRRHPKGMPAALIAAIGRDCARGLAAIHNAKLIHRDVKPSNIFLGTTGLAKLGDLGLCRHEKSDSDLTMHGHLVGTPEFMAPEQALAEGELDHRADIYGLGASMYYLATGRAPYEGGSAWAILAQLINDPFPDPCVLNPNLPKPLADIIRQAGEKDRNLRHKSALALANDLEHVLSGRGERSSASRRLAIQHNRVHHILIVDDDPIIRRVYRSRFELDGHLVLTADNAAQALEIVRTTIPDLMLVDLMLPDMDGLALLKRLHEQPELRKIPIVVFSNAFEEEQHELARVAGARRVLSKAGCSPRFVSHIVQEILIDVHGASSARRPAVKPGDPPSGKRVDVKPDHLAHLAESSLIRLLMLLRDLEASDAADHRVRILGEIAGTAHGLGSAAGLVQHECAALLAQAVEQLARQLLEWPDRITSSSRRTLTQAVLVLRSLLPDFGTPYPLPSGDALILDDDVTSLRLATQALTKVRMSSTTEQDPHAALAELTKTQFAIVLTDVVMEGMNGVQFATKMRALPNYRQTPLIFVTGLTDFRQRLGALADPLIDVIAKPYLLIELATKALALRLTPSQGASALRPALTKRFKPPAS